MQEEEYLHTTHFENSIKIGRKKSSLKVYRHEVGVAHCRAQSGVLELEKYLSLELLFQTFIEYSL